MKGIILAAGKGTRLAPYTKNRPKVMVEIGGNPVLEYGIRLFKKHGIEQIYINLHYSPQVIQNYFGDGQNWGVHIQYHFEKELLGTAGAVKAFEKWLGKEEEIMVLYGDNLTDCDLTAMRHFHRTKGAELTMAFIEEDAVLKSGIIAIDQNSRIVKILEKPKPEQVFSHYVNAGIMLLSPSVLDLIPGDKFYDFGYHLLPKVIEKGRKIYAYPLQGYLVSIDTPQYYHQAQKTFMEKEHGKGVRKKE